jgi:hypothetical protein
MRATTDAVLGKGHRLRMKAGLADKGSMVSDLRPMAPRDGRRRERERGQALVEFALILPLFLMIVVGIIQFAVGLNYWLDMQRLANQGARAAAVNCGLGGNQCTPDLQTRLEEDVVSRGNDPDVVICYVPPFNSPTPGVGDAVRVELTTRYRLAAIVNLAKIDLTATATMRLEQVPSPPALPDPTVNSNWCST